MGFDAARFVDEVDAELICSICHGVLENPRQVPQCEHAFCDACILGWLERHRSCPVDRIECDASQLKPIPRIMKNLLYRLLVRCEYAEFGCQAVVRLEQLETHQQECEFNPKKPVVCELGCELVVSKDQLKDHNCVRELRAVVEQQQGRLSDLQLDVNEIRIHYSELRRELRTIKDNMRGVRLTSPPPAIQSPQRSMEVDDIARWVASLPMARVLRWGGMISTPDAALQSVMRRSLLDSGCPLHCVDELMDSAHERRWPPGLGTLEMRQQNRRHFENYVCRRIPGRQAVLVMACENIHMSDDLTVDPGIVMIFAHGVE